MDTTKENMVSLAAILLNELRIGDMNENYVKQIVSGITSGELFILSELYSNDIEQIVKDIRQEQYIQLDDKSRITFLVIRDTANPKVMNNLNLLPNVNTVAVPVPTRDMRDRLFSLLEQIPNLETVYLYDPSKRIPVNEYDIMTEYYSIPYARYDIESAVQYLYLQSVPEEDNIS